MRNPWSTFRAFQHTHRGAGTLEQRQTDWLIACLQRNRDTVYGRRHGFGKLNTIRDYQERVPMVRYADLEPYIERAAGGEVDILFEGQPVAFEQTGGSSGGSKLIPYSAASLDDFRYAMLPWLGDLVASHNISGGSAYLALSPATRQMQTTAGGVPVGLPDGAYLGEVAGQALQELSAVPSWVGGIPDVAAWQLATLYWLLRQQGLVLVSVWSPSFFWQLLEGLGQRRTELLELLGSGGQIAGQPLPADRPARKRLERYLRDRDSRQLWPGLKLVSCWMDGASRQFAEPLRQRLPQARFQAKGLLATEGVTTIPSREGRPLLAADSGFYEFLGDGGRACCAWELEEGRDYEVVLTTAGGLYRYRSGDRVRYAGMVRGLPELRFLGRNDLCSDLVGEKLTEAFVAECLQGIRGFCMLAAVNTSRPHYTLITASEPRALVNVSAGEQKIPPNGHGTHANSEKAGRGRHDRFPHPGPLPEGEGDTERESRDHLCEPPFPKEGTEELAVIEGRLMANPQYAYARKLGQLGPLTVTPHAAPLQAYIKLAFRQQRLGDVKVPALLPPSIDVDVFMETHP